MKKKFFSITICYLLAGCGVSPDAQHSQHTNQTGQAPCKPDTVYVEVGSGSWWGVLPAGSPGTPPDYPVVEDTLDTATDVWYWHTVNDTVKVPARVMRNAWPRTDTLRDTFTQIIYRDSIGKWHTVADSLQQHIAMLETIRRKGNHAVGIFFSLILIGIGGYFLYHYITFNKRIQHERSTE